MTDLSVIGENLLNPAILFFLLGLVAVFIKSDLAIPQPVSRFLSYYLLFSIGLKGGVEIAENAGDTHMYALLGIALLTRTQCQCLLHCRAGCHAGNDTKSQPRHLRTHVAGHYLSAQYHHRNSRLFQHS